MIAHKSEKPNVFARAPERDLARSPPLAQDPTRSQLAQELVQREDADGPVLLGAVAQIHPPATGDRASSVQFDETATVLGSPTDARLDFDPDGEGAATPHEVDLGAGRRSTVRKLTATVRVGNLRTQFVQHPAS